MKRRLDMDAIRAHLASTDGPAADRQELDVLYPRHPEISPVPPLSRDELIEEYGAGVNAELDPPEPDNDLASLYQWPRDVGVAEYQRLGSCPVVAARARTSSMTHASSWLALAISSEPASSMVEEQLR
jgi:hypothetical protein